MPMEARMTSVFQSSMSQSTVPGVQYWPHQLLQPNDMPRSCTGWPVLSTIRLPLTANAPWISTGVPDAAGGVGVGAGGVVAGGVVTGGVVAGGVVAGGVVTGGGVVAGGVGVVVPPESPW